MDATIRPNRALSPRGFWILMGLVVAWNVVVAGFMFAIGAFPVPVFLGLDVVLLAVAFTVMFRRQASVSERVRVSAEAVTVERLSGRSSLVAWRSAPSLTRVEVTQDADSTPRVRLARSGRRLPVGAALSPKERSAFGRALEAAVARARAERWPAP